jgi:hypothetical protein
MLSENYPSLNITINYDMLFPTKAISFGSWLVKQLFKWLNTLSSLCMNGSHSDDAIVTTENADATVHHNISSMFSIFTTWYHIFWTISAHAIQDEVTIDYSKLLFFV